MESDTCIMYNSFLGGKYEKSKTGWPLGPCLLDYYNVTYFVAEIVFSVIFVFQQVGLLFFVTNQKGTSICTICRVCVVLNTFFVCFPLTINVCIFQFTFAVVVLLIFQLKIVRFCILSITVL